jgi:hypothetical protein
MTRSSNVRVVLASGALSIGALAGLSGVVLTQIASAGASTTSWPNFCINAAELPNSPSEVALHWPTLSKAPTQVQESEVSLELSNLESALSPAPKSGPAPLLEAFFTARTAASAELFAVGQLNPGFNAPPTNVAIAGYLSTVHRQATIGSRALSGTATKIRQLCRTYVGTSVARRVAIDTATYAAESPQGPTRNEILMGAAHSLPIHAVKVLAMTPSSGTVTRVTYSVPIIYRTDVVCVALPPLRVPSVVAC